MDLTRGHKLNLLVLALATLGIELLGTMARCVGFFYDDAGLGDRNGGLHENEWPEDDCRVSANSFAYKTA